MVFSGSTIFAPVAINARRRAGDVDRVAPGIVIVSVTVPVTSVRERTVPKPSYPYLMAPLSGFTTSPALLSLLHRSLEVARFDQVHGRAGGFAFRHLYALGVAFERLEDLRLLQVFPTLDRIESEQAVSAR
jgi:hypothetical protein